MKEYIENRRKDAPELFIENEVILKAYQEAVNNLLCINTVPCSMEVYNKTGLLNASLPLMIRAGGEYQTPWTRDATVNTMNVACFIEPEVAKNTLWAVCECIDGKLYFQMDNQKWDKIIWATGAWEYFLATGDIEFLHHAYETIKNSLELLEQVQFNEKYGLFTGGSFFNDGITGYPKDLHEQGNASSFVGDHPATEKIMTLSTNCLYYAAYRILEKMVSSIGAEEQQILFTNSGKYQVEIVLGYCSHHIIYFRESLPLCRYCKGPFRNGSPWRGFFEPSTAPFRYERECVQTVSTKRRLIFNIGVNSNCIREEVIWNILVFLS